MDSCLKINKVPGGLLKSKIDKKFRIVVIGGIAAGTSAAVKARRATDEAEIIIYEKYKHISYGTCGLPYFVSGKIADVESLVINTVQQFEKRFNIEVNILKEVTGIDRSKKELTVRDVRTGKESRDHYDKLIIATGSFPIIINEDLYNAVNTFNLRTIDDAMHLKEYMKFLKNKSRSPEAVIIGGGYIGLELIDAFLSGGFKVTIIEKTDQLLPIFDFEMIEYLENYLVKKGVRILKDQEVTDFNKDEDNRITSIRISPGQDFLTDILFISVGTRPDSRLAGESGLEIGGCGAIKVDDHMQTSDPDIFAAGDCCECLNFVTGKRHAYNLATIANIQGRTAGYNAVGGSDRYSDSIPTSIIKVLDLVIGKTGIGFREAKDSLINAAKIEFHFLNHAGYYPGASMMHMMAVYDIDTGDILGFQGIGFEGIDKKTDVMSTAIRAKMKIWDLVKLDLGYHPQYGSAKDPLNMLGMIGENIRKGEVRFMDVEELKDLMKKKEELEIIDVRTVKEYRAGHIDGAVNIPLDELRDNINSLDMDSRIVVHCRSSYRSYLAYRILKNAGFKNVWNLNGSYLSWVRKI